MSMAIHVAKGHITKRRIRILRMLKLTPDDELEIACLIGTTTSCRGLELLKLTMENLRYEREKNKTLIEWQKILDRRIERMKNEKCYHSYPD